MVGISCGNGKSKILLRSIFGLVHIESNSYFSLTTKGTHQQHLSPEIVGSLAIARHQVNTISVQNYTTIKNLRVHVPIYHCVGRELLFCGWALGGTQGSMRATGRLLETPENIPKFPCSNLFTITIKALWVCLYKFSWCHNDKWNYMFLAVEPCVNKVSICQDQWVVVLLIHSDY